MTSVSNEADSIGTSSTVKVPSPTPEVLSLMPETVDIKVAVISNSNADSSTSMIGGIAAAVAVLVGVAVAIVAIVSIVLFCRQRYHIGTSANKELSNNRNTRNVLYENGNIQVPDITDNGESLTENVYDSK